MTVASDLCWFKCYDMTYSGFLQNLLKNYQYGKVTSHFASRFANKICAHLQCWMFPLVTFLTLDSCETLLAFAQNGYNTWEG